MTNWPDWWTWELEISPHVLKRMVDRQFGEVDLRRMLEDASGYHENDEVGRRVVETRHDGRSWEVIVEPLPSEEIVLVITAYPVETG